METRTRKLSIGFASNESLTNLPKASMYNWSVVREDDWAIVIIMCVAARRERRGKN